MDLGFTLKNKESLPTSSFPFLPLLLADTTSGSQELLYEVVQNGNCAVQEVLAAIGIIHRATQ